MTRLDPSTAPTMSWTTKPNITIRLGPSSALPSGSACGQLDWAFAFMTLLVIADDDEVRHQIAPEPADVVVACGDLADWTILQIAKAARCFCIYAVKGNHDSSGAFPSPIVDLHLVVREHAGLRFGGFNGSWKYKPRSNYLYDQSEARRLLTGFPAVDVFVSHNSPRHVHDREDEVHFGFDACLEYIHRVQPRLFLHGHQHVNQETLVGTTRVLGVYGHKWIEL